VKHSPQIRGVAVRSKFRRFWREQLGADIPEYALLVGLLAVGILAAIYAYGLANSNSFSGATDGLNAAAPTSAQGGGGGAGSQGGGSGSGSGQSGQGGGGGSGSGQSGDGGSGGSPGGGSGGSGGGAGTVPNNPTPLNPSHGSGSGGSGGGSSQ